VHGLGSDGATWWRLASELAEDGYLVVAPDLRGHGRSPAAVDHRIGTLATDAAALGSGWDLVVGHSLGGAIAADLLAQPELGIAAAVLVDPVLRLEDEDRPELHARLRDEAGGVTPEDVRRVHPGWDERDVWRKVLATRAVTPDVIDAVLHDNDPWDVVPLVADWGARVHLLAGDPELGGSLAPGALGSSRGRRGRHRRDRRRCGTLDPPGAARRRQQGRAPRHPRGRAVRSPELHPRRSLGPPRTSHPIRRTAVTDETTPDAPVTEGSGADEPVTYAFEAEGAQQDEVAGSGGSPVVVYWRPGCMFSSGLIRGLERWGLEFERIDIWEDPEGAAFVRSVADGAETVPTVLVAGLALVNPTPRDVLRVVAERAPEVLPEAAKQDLARPPSRIGQVLGRVLGGDS
jgi:pimeloyl-ACP methyl ester carboxylesterase/glutaredoxin